MRLVTRSDFDGLACGALLKEAGIIDNWKFAHPKDLQDGLVEVETLILGCCSSCRCEGICFVSLPTTWEVFADIAIGDGLHTVQ